MSNSLFTEIQQYITYHNLIPSGSKVVIGLSGGPDSILLLYALNHLKITFDLSLIAVHLDHGWRNNSADDVLFCKKVCDTLNIPLVSARLQDLALPAHKLKGSKEEVGRHARRFVLEQVASEQHAQVIALGQHADDQTETFFIRLLRGSTLAGLTGIKPRDGMYVRPLLAVYKQEIIDYLHEHGIEYLTDPTNEHDTYLRNRIRKYVIPALRQTDERFDHNFVRTLDSLQETEEYLARQTIQIFEQCAQQVESLWTLSKNKLLALDTFMQKRILVMWLIKNNVPFTLSENFLTEILRFINLQASKSHRMHAQWSITKKKDILTIEK